jgi:general secretion pathway protein J
MPTSERIHGFTLLEMLVVLLIAGIALALSSQALGQYQRAHTRAIASERLGREQRLSEHWFRDSVRGLFPAAASADARATLRFGMDESSAPAFHGDADGFEGVTLAPVFGQQGTSATQSWRIVRAPGTAVLQLDESGRTVALNLPRARDMRFHYLGADGKLEDRWPPRLGTPAQLPEAVLLELVPQADGTGGGLVAAAILGPRDPPLVPYEYAPE